MKLLMENWRKYLIERETDQIYSEIIDFLAAAFADKKNYEFLDDEEAESYGEEKIDFSDPKNEVAIARNDASTGAPTHFAIRAYGDVVSGLLQQERIDIGPFQRFKRVTVLTPNISEIISVFDSEGNQYYEVDYLAQDTIFEEISNNAANDPTLHQYNNETPYLLKLKHVPRRFISRVGNFLVRYVGGVINIKDCTSGYRAIKSSFLRDLDFSYLSTRGYSFQSSLICDLGWQGAIIAEIPIIFNSRKAGDSKLSLRDQIEFLQNIPRLGFRNIEDFFKYSLVGFSGVFINLGIYAFLTRYYNFSEAIAPLLSIEAALISNFLLNNFWTFGSRSNQSRVRVKFIKFHLVSGLGALINYLVFLLLFFFLEVHDIFANLIGIAFAAVVNYLINSNWTWKDNK